MCARMSVLLGRVIELDAVLPILETEKVVLRWRNKDRPYMDLWHDINLNLVSWFAFVCVFYVHAVFCSPG